MSAERAEAVRKAPNTEKAEANEAGTKLLECVIRSGENYTEIRQNGVWHASRVRDNNGATIIDMYQGGKDYSDTFKDGTHLLKERSGSSFQTPWVDIKEGSQKYKNVLDEMKQINFDEVTACAKLEKPVIDKGYHQSTSSDWVNDSVGLDHEEIIRRLSNPYEY